MSDVQNEFDGMPDRLVVIGFRYSHAKIDGMHELGKLPQIGDAVSIPEAMGEVTKVIHYVKDGLDHYDVQVTEVLA